MIEYLLHFELLSTDAAGEVSSQWVSTYLQGELGTVGELRQTAFNEGQALAAQYGVVFAGVGQIELEEV